MSDETRLEILGVSWPDVRAGDDLAALLLEHVELHDGDVVAVTSKVVSKAEGRAVTGPRPEAVAAEATRVLARRGDSVIAETGPGLVLAAAGVDSSNVEPGTSLLLPLAPDRTARVLRAAALERAGVNIAVVITDTAGRAWRNGQVDLAIGCAGLAALTDLSGTTDPFGNVLAVTAPAIADEIASAGDLVKGKTRGRPVAVLRGLTDLVLPPGDHGLGAAELVRSGELDLFGLGAREAALAAALRTDPVALDHFPPRVAVDPEPFSELADLADLADLAEAGDGDLAVRLEVTPLDVGWQTCVLVTDDAGPDALVLAGRVAERCAVVAAAYRLTASGRPAATANGGPGWRPVDATVWVPR